MIEKSQIRYMNVKLQQKMLRLKQFSDGRRYACVDLCVFDVILVNLC